MDAILSSIVSSSEWRARTDPLLGRMEPSWAWLPKLCITSWERKVKFYPLNIVKHLIENKRWIEIDNLVAMLLYPFESLEQNDLGEWEVTSVMRQELFRMWFSKEPYHLVEVWASFARMPKLTFEQWRDVTCDILASGADLFAFVYPNVLKQIVDNFRPRAKHATRVFAFMLERYEHDLNVLFKYLKYGQRALLLMISVRPEWLLTRENRDYVVAQCLLQSHDFALIQLELYLGLCKHGQYWPSNTLPDAFSLDAMEDEMTVDGGMYAPEGWMIDEDMYEYFQSGSQIVADMGVKTFKALLKSDVIRLSSWCAEHDPNGYSCRSLALFLQANVQSAFELWAKNYRFFRKGVAIWARAIMQIKVPCHLERLKEDLFLLCLFDRSNMWHVTHNETSVHAKQILGVLKHHVRELGPRMLVAILHGLLQEFDSMQVAIDFIKMCADHTQIKWNVAYESFARDEMDRVTSVLQLCLLTRFPKRNEVDNEAIVPFAPREMFNGAFPWEYLLYPNTFLDDSPVRCMPVSWTGVAQRHKTLGQVVQISQILFQLPSWVDEQRRDKVSCLYLPERGIEREWALRKVEITINVGGRVVGDPFVASMTGAFVAIVKDSMVRRVAVNDSTFAEDVALAGCLDSRVRVVDLFEHLEQVDSNVAWNVVTVSNKIDMEATRRVHTIDLLIDEGEPSSYVNVSHVVACFDWKIHSGQVESMCTWEYCGSFTENGSDAVVAGFVDGEIVVEGREDKMMLGDSFCGPLVSGVALRKGNTCHLKNVPLGWTAVGYHARHLVKPMYRPM